MLQAANQRGDVVSGRKVTKVCSSSNSRLESAVLEAAQLRYRLVLVVGPARTGKTSMLRSWREQQGWPLINVNLLLAERLISVPIRKRPLRVPHLMDEISAEHEVGTLLFDNIELLFQPDLQQDPLRLLQGLSRNRTVVASWPGRKIGDQLTYAALDHPEYWRYDDPEAIIVSTADSLEYLGAPHEQESSK